MRVTSEYTYLYLITACHRTDVQIANTFRGTILVGQLSIWSTCARVNKQEKEEEMKTSQRLDRQPT